MSTSSSAAHGQIINNNSNAAASPKIHRSPSGLHSIAELPDEAALFDNNDIDNGNYSEDALRQPEELPDEAQLFSTSETDNNATVNVDDFNNIDALSQSKELADEAELFNDDNTNTNTNNNNNGNNSEDAEADRRSVHNNTSAALNKTEELPDEAVLFSKGHEEAILDNAMVTAALKAVHSGPQIPDYTNTNPNANANANGNIAGYAQNLNTLNNYFLPSSNTSDGSGNHLLGMKERPNSRRRKKKKKKKSHTTAKLKQATVYLPKLRNDSAIKRLQLHQAVLENK